MNRIVLVSNRVLDLSKAARAGGVAVVLANVVRTRKAMWFGWNGEVKTADQMHVVERQGSIVTTPLSEIEYARYYLGYANSVLWPVFHNRLDLAKFEAGFFQHFVEVNRRFAGLLLPMLGPDDLIWVHDYELILLQQSCAGTALRIRSAFFCTSPFHPGKRSWRFQSTKSSRARSPPMI